jgi:hypothetical protein
MYNDPYMVLLVLRHDSIGGVEVLIPLGGRRC